MNVREQEVTTIFRQDSNQIQFMQPALCHLRSRQPNCRGTDQVPAIIVLGRTVGRLRKQQANVLDSEIEMFL